MQRVQAFTMELAELDGLHRDILFDLFSPTVRATGKDRGVQRSQVVKLGQSDSGTLLLVSV